MWIDVGMAIFVKSCLYHCVREHRNNEDFIIGELSIFVRISFKE